MKRVIVILLAATIALAFCSCYGETQEDQKEPFTYAFNGEKFDTASDFDCGYALVTKKDKTFFIDLDGNIGFVLPSEYELQEQFHEGKPFQELIKIYLGQGIYYIEPSDHSFLKIYDIEGNSTSINNRIEMSRPFPLLAMGQTVFEIAASTNEEIREIGDSNGDIIYSTKKILTPMRNVRIGYLKGKTNKNLVFPDYLDYTNKDEIIYLEWNLDDSKSHLVDMKGNYILNPDGSKFYFNSNEPSGNKENMLIFKDGVARYLDCNRIRYIRDDGKHIDSKDWETYSDFSESYAVILDDDKLGFIDKDGNVVVQPQYQNVGDVHNGFAWIQNWDNSYQYIKFVDPEIDKKTLNDCTIILDSSTGQ
ncbi:MAG TPA: WG repeat-containing protein [Patescibacteria group bacterium]|nr:WG repeat-containing protein [Patescibacteria group bacterium]